MAIAVTKPVHEFPGNREGKWHLGEVFIHFPRFPPTVGQEIRGILLAPIFSKKEKEPTTSEAWRRKGGRA